MSTDAAAPAEPTFAGDGDGGPEDAPWVQPYMSKLGSWTLKSKLGEGGSSHVWLAEHREGHFAAVKVHLDLSSTDRFRREYTLAVREPGVWTPAVLDADLSAAPPWIAMEFVADPSLRDVVTAPGKGPLRGEPLTVFARDLADVVATMAAASIAHRDLSARNVKVDEVTGRPRLLDLGLARDYDDEGTSLTKSAALFGTSGFAAPEQLLGGPVGLEADVWGWGAVVFFAATGRTMVPAGTMAAYRAALGARTPIDFSDVPDAIAAALDAALRYDPEDRDLGAVVAQLPLRAHEAELASVQERLAEVAAELAAARDAADTHEAQVRQLQAQHATRPALESELASLRLQRGADQGRIVELETEARRRGAEAKALRTKIDEASQDARSRTAAAAASPERAEVAKQRKRARQAERARDEARREAAEFARQRDDATASRDHLVQQRDRAWLRAELIRVRLASRGRHAAWGTVSAA